MSLQQIHQQILSVIKHAIDWFGVNEGYVPEYWVTLRPTTPLREPKDFKRMEFYLDSLENSIHEYLLEKYKHS